MFLICSISNGIWYEMSKRYIENEFQKKMLMEMEECSSIVNDVEIEPIMSRCRQ
ncbi:hypothetical protein [Wolbachia endosymbiont (group B) of Idaea biselata]|uniref:hypothetical protein n=1 Tax=Wolbachia endosymbiont (group B) of Idaea biselata TaxID=3066179 RepID=UPI003132B41F